ncbi:hypothetical protein EYZ11_002744 [Aspergillus tanneri]|uniref:Origin recognition complex subunit 4 n=1 Tax=Aspergillus tanneri TaxID=1220188 RepID=A0A4S3JQ37_9EURO|nr:uncharacterized protein ATNIH1004_003312 [Aspergillus tanneri]KAA8650625.1 hypothetical protein ATNIH1004_003312 [Aspergillus tanneri]THC97762.1 hypothetical protein EYZ11_002744 [Aspergillus tanneri]
MKGPRASKRRRVSDVQVIDEDGDIAMHNNNEDVFSGPPSPTPQKRAVGKASLVDKKTESPSASRSAPRQLSKGDQTTVPETATNGQEKENNSTETSSQAGLRSSGRQRKPPQRLEDEVINTPSARKSITAPERRGHASRNVRRSRHVSEMEESGDESPQSQSGRVTRTRSKRTSVRFDATNTDSGRYAVDGNDFRHSPSPDDYQDELDDLLSMQLQQDLTKKEGVGQDEVAPTDVSIPAYAERFQALSQTGLTEELRTMAELILEKLNGKRLIPLKGLENEYNKVLQLLEQTVEVGEGNSMLLLGSRGSGKTAIVETIISSLRKQHKNDFHVVRLNGFLHTDDRLALREIWRQLGREMNTEDEAGKVGSYADTMATLLALLSHPEELFGSPDSPDTVTAAKSIIIILDEFDLFATHPRQTLLYNLFDIAQARKAPVAVLGLTTKVDVTEMLEKRVKSRFSHRYVFVPLPRTFDVFSEICLAGLDLDKEDVREMMEADDAKKHSVVKSEGWDKLLEGWKAYLQGLWSDEAFRAHLQRIYYQSKSVREFLTSALIGMTELYYSTYPSADEDGLSFQIPTPTTFSSQSLSCPDPAPLPFSVSTTVSSSSLPLSLLLAATRLAALFDPGLEASQSTGPLALSFPAAYAEYVRLLTSAKTSASVSGAVATPGRVWGQEVAREAWEKLVSWGLIGAVGGGSGTANGRMFRVEISFEEVVAMAGSGGSLGKWWRDG